MNLLKALALTLALIVAHGCASAPGILGGAEGKLDWCIDIKIPAIEPVKACINGERTHGDRDDSSVEDAT